MRQAYGTVRYRYCALMGAQDLYPGDLARELGDVVIGRVQDQLLGRAYLDHAAIAERLGIRAVNSRANYYQALRRLRAELGEEP